MTPKEHINPPSLFPSLRHGFSQIVIARGGKTVYISGQTAWDVNKQIVGGMDLGGQTRQALRNVRTAVEAVGGTMADVVSLRIYVVNYKPEDAVVVGEALREFFPAEAPPTSTWLGVTSLAVRDFLIEIEAIAVVCESE
ncbi:MAG TPA: RidA family protein [Blastocatellia bacterium]|nr:RidA family protein [Blastocatellia bacterium]